MLLRAGDRLEAKTGGSHLAPPAFLAKPQSNSRRILLGQLYQLTVRSGVDVQGARGIRERTRDLRRRRDDLFSASR
ncbi:MAG TPA: hypothetical protein VIY48_07660, partial [Candidatus Paceibacterota bacterium]